ncbi:hypothetical protein [Streptosporangium sp. NPDC004631]
MAATPPAAGGAPGRKAPTPAQRYADAVWDADPDDLAQAELAMALCYANHSHRAPHDRAWVTNERLMQQCKIRSTSTVTRVRDSLVAKGWLVALHPQTGVPLSEAERRAFQKKRKTIPYRLTVPASSTIEVEEAPSATSTIEATTSIIDPHYFDDRQLPSYDPLKNPPSLGEPDRQTAPAVVSTVEEREDHQGEDQTPTSPPKVPGVSADLAERVMAQTTATAAEFVRVMEDARRDGIRTPGPWLRSEAGAENFLERLAALRAAPSATRSGPPGVGDYRQAIRAACEEHGTPGGSARCALCRRQAQVQPRRDQAPPAGEEHPTEPPTSGERDTAVARLRAQLADKRPPRATTPARFIPAAAETPPAVTAARTYLNQCGDGLHWMSVARKKLGGSTADRDEVTVLAATLAHEHHDRIPAAR